MKVTFEEEGTTNQSRTRNRSPQQKSGKMTGFLLKKGVVKNHSQANLVLLAFIAIIILFTIRNLLRAF